VAEVTSGSVHDLLIECDCNSDNDDCVITPGDCDFFCSRSFDAELQIINMAPVCCTLLLINSSLAFSQHHYPFHHYCNILAHQTNISRRNLSEISMFRKDSNDLMQDFKPKSLY
jgi:hypothetical protein